MKRILRFVVIGVVALCILFSLALWFASSFVNPNEYKPQIIAAVKNATGRDLKLHGDLGLSLFPGVSVQSGRVELSQDAAFGTSPLISIEKIKAHLAVFPLLFGTVKIGEVTLEGVTCNLIVAKDGRANWEMQPAGAPAAPKAEATAKDAASVKAPELQIDELSFKNIRINYKNLAGGDDITAVIETLKLTDLMPGKKSAFSLACSYSDNTTKQNLKLNLDGAIQIPASPLTGPFHFSAKGKLDATTLAADITFALNMGAKGIAPDVQGKIQIGELNIDKYTQSQGDRQDKAAPPAAKPAQKQGEAKKTDLSALRTLSMKLHVAMESLVVAKTPLRNIKADIVADKGLITISPFTLTLGDGLLDGKASLDARKAIALIATDGAIKNVKVDRILKDRGDKQAVSGEFDAQWNITGSDIDWPALSRSLQGNAALRFRNGLIPGFQIIPQGISGIPAKRQDIQITHCNADWRIDKGVATSNNLDILATGITVTGGGKIVIPENTLEYRLDISMPAIPVIPAKIAGPLDSPSYSVDSGEFLKNTAKDSGKILEGVKSIFGGGKK